MPRPIIDRPVTRQERAVTTSYSQPISVPYGPMHCGISGDAFLLWCRTKWEAQAYHAGQSDEPPRFDEDSPEFQELLDADLVVPRYVMDETTGQASRDGYALVWSNRAEDFNV